MNRGLSFLQRNGETEEVHDNNQDLYSELWNACAGSDVHVPHVGQLVFYYPQGHMEQVAAYTQENCEMKMPVYNLPSKILCKVLSVQLKAETSTDEVFARITLLPIAEQDEQILTDEYHQSLPLKSSTCSFSKKLTPSDTNTHGGFSIPKRHAEECLPHLDLSQQPPVQELIARDLHGTEWHFRHIFRGQPKRHLLTSGWSIFVTSKKLLAGDAFIFLRGKNGEHRVGVRRKTSLQNNESASVISGQSMQHGVLASAFHAISTGTRFDVYYRPWTSPAEFIISFSHYMKSARMNHYSIGTRFKLHLEGEECVEQGYGGTVVGIEETDPIRWPDSEWRRLKVKWDVISNIDVRPERISPWEIEPEEPTMCSSDQTPPKRRRHFDSPTSLMQTSVEFASQSGSGVFQGQEKGESGMAEMEIPHPPLILNGISPLHPDRGIENFESENQVPFSMHNMVYSYELDNHRGLSKNDSFTNHSSNEQSGIKLKEGELPISNTCMVFGVDFFNPPELPSVQAAMSDDELESLGSLPQISHSSLSECTDSTKQCTNPSCIKVLKHGSALGRSVDLSLIDGYEKLISQLDKLFKFKGSLIEGSSGWHVTYMDSEGDMMLLGDNSWQDFKAMTRKLVVQPKEDIDEAI